MQVTMSVSEDTLRCLFTDAIQGPGAAYWANDYEDLTEDRDTEGYTVRFGIGQPSPRAEEGTEPPVRTSITLDTIKEAVQWLMQHAGEAGACHPTYIRGLVHDDYDSTTADCVLQVAVFGKVIYG